MERGPLIKEIIRLQALRDKYIAERKSWKAQECEERIESLQSDVIRMAPEGGKAE